MPNYLYAYKVAAGIKIGTTVNLEKRKAQHSSAGISVVYFTTVKINKPQLDTELKSALIELGKQVKLKNSSSTEVFKVNEEETKAIFSYIKTCQKINTEILKRILEADTVCEQKIITLAELKDNYTNGTFVNFRYQRFPDTEHVDDIRKYITENYMRLTFILPPVVVIIKQNKTYEVVDGMHRCMAIKEIPDGHPCLRYKISISSYNRILADSDRINIFRTINKSKPVHEIYLDPNATKSILTKVTGQLQQDFGKSIIEKNSLSIYIEKQHLIDLFTMENINLLIQKNKIRGITEKELYKLITDVNNFIYNDIISFDNNIFDVDYDHEEITEESWDSIHEFMSRVNAHTSKQNITKYKKIFNSIREEHQLRVAGKKELKIRRTYNLKPFMLNLIDFTKTSLLNIILMD